LHDCLPARVQHQCDTKGLDASVTDISASPSVDLLVGVTRENQANVSRPDI